MTGTVPEYEYQAIAVKAMIGDVVNEITTKELQDRDILSKCNINILQIQDSGEYKTYQDELNYLLTNKNRMTKIAAMIEDIARSGNTLVVFDRIACGKMLVEMIEGATFISGTNKSKERVAEYKRINDEDNAIVLASSGIVSTGINIPRIFNLVIIEPGKSFIKVVQTVGRGVRKAADKDHVEVWDFTSSLKYSKRHLTKRKAFYKLKEFPYKVTKVQL
jgi:superfamily II DNA or RNA helicase